MRTLPGSWGNALARQEGTVGGEDGEGKRGRRTEVSHSLETTDNVRSE